MVVFLLAFYQHIVYVNLNVPPNLMCEHLQHGNVAFVHRYLVPSYLSHSVLGGELDHQVVS